MVDGNERDGNERDANERDEMRMRGMEVIVWE